MVSPVRTRVSPDGPPEGGEVPDLTPAPPLYAPGANAEDIAEIPEAGRLGHEEAFLSADVKPRRPLFSSARSAPHVDRSSTDKQQRVKANTLREIAPARLYLYS
jgi:hypothetical protein